MASKGKPAARIGDMCSGHQNYPPTPIIQGSTNVFVNGRCAARAGDQVLLHAAPGGSPHTRQLADKPASVFVNNKPMMAVSDDVSCGGSVVIGSSDTIVGNSPKLLKPEEVNLPDIEFSHNRSGGTAEAKSVKSDALSTNASPTVTYDAPSQSSDNDASSVEDAPLTEAEKKQAEERAEAAKAWEARRDSSRRFISYLAAHLMSLNAKSGYSIAEGLQGTFSSLPKEQLQKAVAHLSNEVAQPLTNPEGTYEQIKSTAEFLSQFPISQEATLAFEASKDINPENLSPKMLTRLSTLASSNVLPSINKKRITPNSLEDAEARLKQRRADIAKNGYKSKYTDEELVFLANAGDVGEERFQVRLMEKDYLNHWETPNEELSGALGLPMPKGKSKGAKYWSTSFDQIEDADSDPRLLSEKLGLDHNPETEYVLVVIDNEKALPLAGTKSVSATFDGVSETAYNEAPSDFPKEFTDKVMNDEYQTEYTKHHGLATDSGALKNEKDIKGFKKYLHTTELSKDEKKVMLKRMKMHERIGNNQHYLGNGLTKNNIVDSANEFGAVETLNVDRSKVTLKQLNDAGAIGILETTPL